MRTISTEPAGLVTDADLEIGQQVGEYVLEALLGKGGFGTVYRAVHPVIGKQVAIKVLARKYAADPAIVSRFAAEARAVNQIGHRNIIDIFQFSHLPDGRHYYVMEYLDGETLDAYLERTGPMPLAQALPILRALGRALDAAHAKGIAHRDLKPENIYLARDSDGGAFPKLLDFGIAKLLGNEVADDSRHRTATGMPLGTPYYMSPEQCRGKDVDHRTDVYSFGIVAFRMLTGTYPFDGDDYVQLQFKQVNEEAPLASVRNPAVTETAALAIAAMMRKDRAARPQTISAAIAAFDPNATTGSGATPVPGLLLAPPGHQVASAKRPSVTPGAFAETAASTTPPFTGTTAPGPLLPQRRPAVWIGAALVLVCSAAGVMLLVTHSATSEPSAVPGSPRRELADKGGAPPTASEEHPIQTLVGTQPTPADAGPAPSTTVTLTFTKLPAHATVKVGTTTSPGTTPIAVPRGGEAIELVISAPRYTPRTLKVTPDHDQSLDTTLELRPAAPRPRDPHDHDTHDSHDIQVPDFGGQP